jgi:3-phenylpropionate/trans-cinnamate dioxygenase ferredoxin reductase component
MSCGPVHAMREAAVRDNYDVLIVGSGQAGVQTALSLRQGGFAGTIGITGAEEQLPYERPPLSKSFLRGEAEVDEFLFRSHDYWEKNGIELVLGRVVESVDPAAHQVLTEEGHRVNYHHLVWAAGGRARTLSLPGADLDGVFSLRTYLDAARLREKLAPAKRAVIIGGGYIGLEAAAAFAERGVEVTVIEVQERLLARVTCAEVSAFYAGLHRDHGTRILLSSGVEQILGSDGRVTGVELSDGTRLDADFVIVGVGLIPNVEPLSAAGIQTTNGVDVDADCRTSAPDVFAIGDCANLENPFAGGNRVRLESVPNAVEHAKTVANAILSAPATATAPPWFWSHQFDVKLQTVGLQGGHDERVLRGDPASGKFSVIYLRNSSVIALDCINSVADFAQGKQLVQKAITATPDELADPSVPLKNLLTPTNAKT